MKGPLRDAPGATTVTLPRRVPAPGPVGRRPGARGRSMDRADGAEPLVCAKEVGAPLTVENP